MEHEEEIKKFIELALSPNESSLMSFACQIGKIVSMLPAGQIAGQFLPFLTSWLPCDSEKIVLEVTKSVPNIGRAVESLTTMAPLLGVLASSDFPSVSRSLRDAMASLQSECSLDELIAELLKSEFDSVRRSGVKLFEYAKSATFVSDKCKSLVNDRSFIVREAVVASLANMEDGPAKEIALMLVHDRHCRIRGMLTAVCSKREFFCESLGILLVGDSDWVVRAALAKHLVNISNKQRATDFCISLVNDHVWQVKVVALKSLALLLEYVDSEQARDLVNSFKEFLAYPQMQLKTKLIDSYILICVHFREMGISAMKPFATCVMSQSAKVKAYFIRALGETHDAELLTLLPAKLEPILRALAKDSNWRTRAIVAEMLTPYVATENQRMVSILRPICLELAGDEAFDVRHAAATSLGRLVARGQEIPDDIAQMMTSDKFRMRQSYLSLLETAKCLSHIEQMRNICADHIESMLQDPCLQVQALANDIKDRARNETLHLKMPT